LLPLCTIFSCINVRVAKNLLGVKIIGLLLTFNNPNYRREKLNNNWTDVGSAYVQGTHIKYNSVRASRLVDWYIIPMVWQDCVRMTIIFYPSLYSLASSDHHCTGRLLHMRRGYHILSLSSCRKVFSFNNMFLCFRIFLVQAMYNAPQIRWHYENT
jgi:hypothetical protein